MKRFDKKFFTLTLVLTLFFVSAVPAFAYSSAQPRASLVAPEALAVGESVYCSCGFYSINGISNVELDEDDFYISGTGKAVLSDFQTQVSDGLTVTVKFKLTATYPGQIKIATKPDAVFDNAGIVSTGSVPKFIDAKIFNVEGENAHIKMTDREFMLTLFVAPFWYLLNLIGLV
ncbi:MAG: hypothetical protein J6J45_06565 [Clostridia bacterium]|nr:hypothetical protein [Clostridia bacterium]